MTTTTTNGAADPPEALRRSTAADGKTELFNLPGYPLMVRAVDFNRLHAESEMRRVALLDEMQKAALAAGQATAAQAVVQDDLITIRKPTTSAEMLWLLKLAHLVISDVDKTLEKTFAPAQPAAQASRFGSPELQAMIIARCVEKDQAGSVPAVSDLPPLPAPDLRDVGTKPQEIKEFLKGYATEYARTAIAARAPADSVQEDAARYRFLRDCEWRDTDLEPFIRLQLNTLWDAKIDAARKQGATP